MAVPSFIVLLVLHWNARDWTSIEEGTGTPCTGRSSLCLSFYRNCIRIVMKQER